MPTKMPTPALTATATDREVLGALYRATDCRRWRRRDRWLSSAPMGEWYGVTTDEEGRVTALEIPLNRLSGNLPPEMGYLDNLVNLAICNSDLGSTVPAWLAHLPV